MLLFLCGESVLSAAPVRSHVCPDGSKLDTALPLGPQKYSCQVWSRSNDWFSRYSKQSHTHTWLCSSVVCHYLCFHVSPFALLMKRSKVYLHVPVRLKGAQQRHQSHLMDLVKRRGARLPLLWALGKKDASAIISHFLSLIIISKTSVWFHHGCPSRASLWYSCGGVIEMQKT